FNTQHLQHPSSSTTPHYSFFGLLFFNTHIRQAVTDADCSVKNKYVRKMCIEKNQERCPGYYNIHNHIFLFY
ncbi:hypothetical protein ACVN39_24795, partial [Escherichia coli]